MSNFDGISPLQFIDKEIANDLAICQNIPHFCGSVFCLPCIEKWSGFNLKNMRQISQMLYRIVLKLKIKCTNPDSKTHKCEDLDRHLGICELRKEECTLECGNLLLL